MSIARLFWVMTIGGAAIWAGTILIALYASRLKRGPIPEAAAGRMILWGGAVFPAAVLTALLAYSLWLMPGLRPFAGDEGARLRIEVTGHQFWWHVTYHLADGRQVTSANEIRVPVGERVEFTLRSADMIHSFWFPALGGKMDLIPGRTNRLSLLAVKPGTYRGQCAEFCGTSHAHMAFPAVAMLPAAFESWLSARTQPSARLDAAHAGARVFRERRCGDCHRVDGADARGSGGPDLSHVGSRLTIGAGLLPNDEDSIDRFVSHSGLLKPGSLMPAYSSMPDAERRALSSWLKGLQ